MPLRPSEHGNRWRQRRRTASLAAVAFMALASGGAAAAPSTCPPSRAEPKAKPDLDMRERECIPAPTAATIRNRPLGVEDGNDDDDDDDDAAIRRALSHVFPHDDESMTSHRYASTLSRYTHGRIGPSFRELPIRLIMLFNSAACRGGAFCLRDEAKISLKRMSPAEKRRFYSDLGRSLASLRLMPSSSSSSSSSLSNLDAQNMGMTTGKTAHSCIRSEEEEEAASVTTRIVGGGTANKTRSLGSIATERFFCADLSVGVADVAEAALLLLGDAGVCPVRSFAASR